MRFSHSHKPNTFPLTDVCKSPHPNYWRFICVPMVKKWCILEDHFVNDSAQRFKSHLTFEMRLLSHSLRKANRQNKMLTLYVSFIRFDQNCYSMHYVAFPFLASQITFRQEEGDGGGATVRWDGWQARHHYSRLRFGIWAKPLVILNETLGHFRAMLVATGLDIDNEMLGQYPSVFVVTDPGKPKHNLLFINFFLCLNLIRLTVLKHHQI